MARRRPDAFRSHPAAQKFLDAPPTSPHHSKNNSMMLRDGSDFSFKPDSKDSAGPSGPLQPK
jgi:hypothetical protein